MGAAQCDSAVRPVHIGPGERLHLPLFSSPSRSKIGRSPAAQRAVPGRSGQRGRLAEPLPGILLSEKTDDGSAAQAVLLNGAPERRPKRCQLPVGPARGARGVGGL
jgi:hypothetical protein